MFHVPEEYRLTEGPMASTERYGNNGVFIIPLDEPDPDDVFGEWEELIVIASNGAGWEHCSVKVQVRDYEKRPIRTETPAWEEMCKVKDLFWDKHDCVVQFHPPADEYVNYHENVLHLWKPMKYNIMTPPSILIGPPSSKKKK